jgi:hypothetical protein
MKTKSDESNGGLTALNKWVEQVGIHPVTAWRFRRNGWLKTLNICGRVYITPEAIAEFTRRAEAGEFAQEHKAPGRTMERAGKAVA